MTEFTPAHVQMQRAEIWPLIPPSENHCFSNRRLYFQSLTYSKLTPCDRGWWYITYVHVIYFLFMFSDSPGIFCLPHLYKEELQKDLPFFSMVNEQIPNTYFYIMSVFPSPFVKIRRLVTQFILTSSSPLAILCCMCGGNSLFHLSKLRIRSQKSKTEPRFVDDGCHLACRPWGGFKS